MNAPLKVVEAIRLEDHQQMAARSEAHAGSKPVMLYPIDVDLEDHGEIVQSLKRVVRDTIDRIRQMVNFSPVKRVVLTDEEIEYIRHMVEKKTGRVVLSLSLGNVSLVALSDMEREA